MRQAFLGKRALEVLPKVYGPSEDSFLLAQAVEVKKGCSALDLGTGTGIQGINACLKGAEKVVSTDVSQAALVNAAKNAKSLGLLERFEFRKGPLFECVSKNEKFDLIIFNPPYVPSTETRFVDLDGGKKGREVLGRFLKGMPGHLEEGGNCFFLQSSLNGEKETGQALKRAGLSFKVAARKRLFFEELLVFRAGNQGRKKSL